MKGNHIKKVVICGDHCGLFDSYGASGLCG